MQKSSHTVSLRPRAPQQADSAVRKHDSLTMLCRGHPDDPYRCPLKCRWVSNSTEFRRRGDSAMGFLDIRLAIVSGNLLASVKPVLSWAHIECPWFICHDACSLAGRDLGPLSTWPSVWVWGPLQAVRLGRSGRNALQMQMIPQRGTYSTSVPSVKKGRVGEKGGPGVKERLQKRTASGSEFR